MGDFKYQMSMYNLFDYAGVEQHLEKMAAKGWRFQSVGNFFWIYRKAEPAQVKYSVTYVPEVSQFDPGPLEKQRDIEAYCEEAGWKKVDNWMQMQIFCSEQSNAVPIETDESLRLEEIHKSMKKNFLLSHVLLLLVFILNAFTLYNGAKYNWISFWSNSSRLWISGIWICGILTLFFDVFYYFYWYKAAKKAVQNGQECPKPRLYRLVAKASLLILMALVVGLFSSYNKTMAASMLIYLAGILLVIILVRRLQQKLKWKGFSKGANAAVTITICVLLSFVMVGGTTWFSMVTWSREKNPSNVEFYDVGDNSWIIYSDEIPLCIQDFANTEYVKSSTHIVHEQESVLMKKGEYTQTLFSGEDDIKKEMALDYQVITVKADFMYEYALKQFWNQMFRYSEEGEQEKTEYRIMYECEAGTLYRQYYEGLPMAYDWLVLTESKIIPMSIFIEELTEEQMRIIVENVVE